MPLVFVLGTWRGEGVGGYPTLEADFRYGQELTFSHWGKPVLSYSSTSWALDDGRQLARETGWWRVPLGPAGEPVGGLEVMLAHPTGIVEIYLGSVRGTQIELSTDVVARTSTAKDVTANHRLYGLVEGDLAYAVDMAAVGQPLTPHLSARLSRA